MIRQSQTGVYLQDQVRLDRLVAIGGARYDRYRMDTDSRILYQGTDSQSLAHIDQDNLSFRVGALYELDGGFSPMRAMPRVSSRCRGGQAGSGVQTGDRSSVGRGVKFLSDDMSKTATLSAFHITKKNALVTDPDNVYGPKLQTGETVSRGIELEGRADLTSQLDLALNYTLMDMGSRAIPPRCRARRRSGSPDRWRRCGATTTPAATSRGYEWAPACATWGGGRDGCRQHRQGTGLPPDGHVRLLRSRRPQRKPERVGVSLGASNLFNKTYYSCYDQNNCWFGAERSVEARLKYAF